MDWVAILISIPLGAISSIIAWILLTFIIRPKILFSHDISKLFDNNGKPYYRFKFRNIGKRKIYGVEVIARLQFRSILIKSNLEIIFVPLNNNYLPVVKQMKKNDYGYVPKLEFSFIDKKYFRYLPKEICEKIMNDTIILEDILSLEDASLIFIISGFDSISGSRRFFESKKYKKDNIIEGKFQENGLYVVESKMFNDERITIK